MVEDDIMVALDAAEILQGAGYNVIGVADDVEEALRIDVVRPPDLALVDLHLMSGYSGVAVAAALRERGIACLFVTGTAPERAAEEHAMGCLLKSVRLRSLVEAVGVAEDVLSGRPLRPLPRNMRLYRRFRLPRAAGVSILPPDGEVLPVSGG
ncbi:MAG: response regulator [Methylacidiphilales bacterium]|nr:response regulator [Candidatus Methylacidiphilales bacterium]